MGGTGERGENNLNGFVKDLRHSLVCKAHRLLYHSILGLRVIMKKKMAQAKARIWP